MFRIGYGSDIHPLKAGNKLVIGGVQIDSEVGAQGHSDADVLLHALTDAILGALALGDIGSHFPNTDERWRNAESSVFLRYAVGLMKERGYAVNNLDSTITLEAPKLRPFIDEMRENLAEAVEIELGRVSIKAKTAEGMDSVGAGRAIKAEAAVLLVHTADRI